MKTHLLLPKTSALVLLWVLLGGSAGYGASFSAVASGDWSSSVTWGGAVPPAIINSGDSVTIASGFTVTLDQSVSITGLLSSFKVDGALEAASGMALTVSGGSVSGSGVIHVDYVELAVSSGFTYMGDIRAKTVRCASLSLSTAADLLVDEKLELAPCALAILPGGSLDLAGGARIVITGGSLVLQGGTVGLTNSYSVEYSSDAAITGIELTGSGLLNLTVNIDAGKVVKLGGDVEVKGTLDLESGTLSLDGRSLKLSGDVSASGSGYIASTASSSISFNSNAAISGSLRFSGAANEANNLSIKVGAGNAAKISGTLTVNGMIDFTSGALDISSASLFAKGSISGTARFRGSASANLSIRGSTSVATGIIFESGSQLVHAFTIDVGAGNEVVLGSDLDVKGVLTIATGSVLDISGRTFGISGGISSEVSNSGSIKVSQSSGVMVTASAGIATPIPFSGSALGILSVDAGSGSVKLNGDLEVKSRLEVKSGALHLNGHHLTVSGDLALSVSGSISSTASSDLTLSSATASTVALKFTSGASEIKNLHISLGSGGKVVLGSGLVVDGSLSLSKGKIDVGVYELEVRAGGSVSGSSSSNYIIAENGGSLSLHLAGTVGTSVNFPIGTAASFTPAGISLKSGSYGDKFRIGVISKVYVHGTSGGDLSVKQPCVGNTWVVETDALAGLDMAVEVFWPSAIEVNSFNRAEAYLSQNMNDYWDISALASATAQGNGMYSMKRTGVSSGGSFAVFGKAAVTTGISDVAAVKGFEIYPIPAIDELTIESNGLDGKAYYVELVGIQGNLISRFEISSNSKVLIPLDALKPGAYFIRFYNEYSSTYKRFTKL